MGSCCEGPDHVVLMNADEGFCKFGLGKPSYMQSLGDWFGSLKDKIIENGVNDGSLAYKISENLWFWAVGAEKICCKQRTDPLKRGLGFIGMFVLQSNASCSIPATL